MADSFICGGSWNYARCFRSANRYWCEPSGRYHDFGFRVVKDVEPSTRCFRGGGSWFSTAEICRSANRDGVRPSSRYNDGGFRVVKETTNG